MLDERTEYVILTGPSRGNDPGPLEAVILWRGEPGWSRVRDAAERRVADSVFRWTRLRAEEAGNSFVGSGINYAILARDGRSVVVEGAQFDLTRSDSAIVIMVTVPPRGQPRTTATAFMRPELPPDYLQKTWTSGDTIFRIVPDYRRQHAALIEALSRYPAVAAFLR